MSKLLCFSDRSLEEALREIFPAKEQRGVLFFEGIKCPIGTDAEHLSW
jgi:hypothetical protein